MAACRLAARKRAVASSSQSRSTVRRSVAASVITAVMAVPQCGHGAMPARLARCAVIASRSIAVQVLPLHGFEFEVLVRKNHLQSLAGWGHRRPFSCPALSVARGTRA